MQWTDLPAVNAGLNSICTVLLVSGYLQIRKGNVERHRQLMIAAFSCSILFMISYLTYHAQVGSVKFQGTGTIRTIYFAILLSHTVLAAVVPFMAARTLYLGLRERFEKHRRIARWTFPIWLYVSITGVVIYFMLYHF